MISLPTILKPILGDALGTVLDRVMDTLPIPDNEKERARIEADRALAEQAGAIAESASREMEAHRDIVLADLKAGNAFQRLWRPVTSYFVIFMWLQNVTVGPLVNAWTGMVTLPIIPWEHLLAFSAIWLSLYAGGHTAKALFGSRFTR